MSFEEIYPVVRTQATFNVMRYDSRRSDKISELVAQSYEKYLREKKSGKEIQLNNYKHFVTQRAKELDIRSVCKKGFGGTSKIDALGYFQRRSDGKAGVVQFDDFMSFNGRNRTEENYVFQMDLKTFISKLKNIERKIFRLKNFGLTFKEIATKVQMSVSKVFSVLQEVKEKFIKYFQLRQSTS